MPFKKHRGITTENRSSDVKSLYYIILVIMGMYRTISDIYRQEHSVQKGRSYTGIDGIQGKGQFVGLTNKQKLVG